jgi:hypothetical protein
MRRVEFVVKVRKIFGKKSGKSGRGGKVGRWERKLGKFDLADG